VSALPQQNSNFRSSGRFEIGAKPYLARGATLRRRKYSNEADKKHTVAASTAAAVLPTL